MSIIENVPAQRPVEVCITSAGRIVVGYSNSGEQGGFDLLGDITDQIDEIRPSFTNVAKEVRSPAVTSASDDDGGTYEHTPSLEHARYVLRSIAKEHPDRAYAAVCEKLATACRDAALALEEHKRSDLKEFAVYRAALSRILHSVKQAKIPGNDWRRELDLIENTIQEARAGDKETSV